MIFITSEITDRIPSRIFSHLIAEVGQKVQNYQSDLFYDLTHIEKAIIEKEDKTFFIGLRNNGVDGNSYIEARGFLSDRYLSIFEVKVRQNNEKAMTVSLSELDDCDKEKLEKEIQENENG